jgi:hypothetical protein
MQFFLPTIDSSCDSDPSPNCQVTIGVNWKDDGPIPTDADVLGTTITVLGGIQLSGRIELNWSYENSRMELKLTTDLRVKIGFGFNIPRSSLSFSGPARIGDICWHLSIFAWR